MLLWYDYSMTKVTVELFAGQKKYRVRQIVQDLFRDAGVTLDENDCLILQVSRTLGLGDLTILQSYGTVSMETSGAGTTGLVL